jgi:hypothetical protein
MLARILEEFQNIPASSSYSDFKALRLSSIRDDFLVKGPHGEPIFLLSDSSPSHYVIGRSLKYIKAEFHLTCSVQVNSEYINGQFALISCDAGSPDLHEIFLRCVGASLDLLPPLCGTVELENVITELLEVFRVLSEPAAGDITGFWGELWVVANSSDIPLAMSLWHSDIYDRYDFSSPSVFIEVKATTKNYRIHDFSLEQLNLPENGNGFIISLMLQQLSGGTGILDLVENIESVLSEYPHLKKKLWKIVTKTLGSDFSEIVDRRFDTAFASRNARIYRMTDIPSIGPVNDARISNIRFSVDLSSLDSSLDGSVRANVANCFAP